MTTPQSRPVDLAGWQVTAALDGRLGAVVVPVKPAPKHRLIEGLGHVTIGMDPALDGQVWYDADCIQPGREVRCHLGRVGDVLWGRETWQYANWTEDGLPYIRYKEVGECRLIDSGISDEWIENLMDIWAELSAPENYDIDGTAADRRWRPSRQMPEWASRLRFEVVGVRAVQVQSCTDEMASECGFSSEKPYGEFMVWWVEKHGKKHPFTDNPWVWFVEIKRVEVKA